jgi:hypothetical protein
MKTDNFDEAFRRKVESFHPPFRDDEIDRVQGYVNKHIPLSLWQRFGHTFTYTLGSIVIVSLLSTIIYQAYENKTLLSKISDLSKELKQKQVATITTKNTPKSVTVEKIDTVFVTKYVEKQTSIDNDVEENNDVEQISDLPQNTESIKTNTVQNQNSIRQVAQPKDIISSKAIENISKPSVSNQLVGVSTFEPERTNLVVKQKPERSEVFLETGKAATVSAESTTNAGKQESTILSSEPTNLVSNITGDLAEIENISTFKGLYIKELNGKLYNSNDLKNISSLTNRKFYVANFVAKTKEHKSFNFPTIGMPTLKYRIGIGTNADFGQLGTSVLTDILFSKRWSLTSGLNMSLLGFERFGDEDDFKRKTNKNFRDQHPVNIPIGNSIEDIEEHQFLFRVPIYLNYRYPLRKDYSLLLATGTDLDIKLKQFTSYSHYDFFADEKYEGIEEKIPVVPFNNWLLSVGAEKRWKYFSLQLSPYFSYQLRPLSYRKDNFTFGFKLNGFYRLSK